MLGLLLRSLFNQAVMLHTIKNMGPTLAHLQTPFITNFRNNAQYAYYDMRTL